MSNLRSFIRSMVLVAGMSTLGACQTMTGAGLSTSEVTAELTPESAGAISEDMVAKLAEQIGPGSTTIALRSDGSVFGAALEASLRSWGFAVVTDQETGEAITEPLAYVADPLMRAALAAGCQHANECRHHHAQHRRQVIPSGPALCGRAWCWRVPLATCSF